jgi:pantothenate kinase type III
MKGTPTECLGGHLAPVGLEFLFGSGDVPATKEMALEHLKTRRMAAITVLVVSSNVEQAEWVSYMFGEIPSRVYLMKGDDFFGKERHGRYEGMGVDRLCCLRGATDTVGYPALVVDGGTAMTFTAVNSEPYILGGTIGPGILLQLHALSEYTSALPRIDAKKMNKMLTAAKDSDEPIKTFCKDTREQMLVNVAISVASSLHEHIRRFGDILKEEDQEGWKEGDVVHVVLCGGDALTLEMLLPPTVNTILGMEPELPPMEVHVSPWLCHFGVVEVIKEQFSFVENDEEYGNDIKLLGQRVAKEFKQFDEFGENIYRGLIVGVSRDDKSQAVLYRVLYDDGDAEDFTEVELFSKLKGPSKLAYCSCSGSFWNPLFIFDRCTQPLRERGRTRHEE